MLNDPPIQWLVLVNSETYLPIVVALVFILKVFVAVIHIDVFIIGFVGSFRSIRIIIIAIVAVYYSYPLPFSTFTHIFSPLGAEGPSIYHILHCSFLRQYTIIILHKGRSFLWVGRMPWVRMRSLFFLCAAAATALGRGREAWAEGGVGP